MVFLLLSRGREVVSRRAHNPEIGGASPPPATKLKRIEDWESGIKGNYTMIRNSLFLILFLWLRIQTLRVISRRFAS